ncbi:hypothetical protein CYMTET_17401, partial [Cymbomonas tetramitiformis]
ASEQLMMVFHGLLTEAAAECLHEEGTLALGSLVSAMGVAFSPHAPKFVPFILQGLSSHTEYGQFVVAVGTVSDLSNALKEGILPYSQSIMQLLCTAAADPNLNPCAGPVTFSCLGDLAMAIEVAYVPYLPTVMPLLNSLGHLWGSFNAETGEYTQEADPEDRSLHLNAILESYATILQAAKEHPSFQSALLPYTPGIYQLVGQVYAGVRNDELNQTAIGVLGDLADVLGPSVVGLFRQEPLFYADFLAECLSNEENVVLKDVAEFARDSIAKILHVQ